MGLMRAYGILAPPIHRPLDLVADDVVNPIGGDEEDSVCVLYSRGYLKGLVLSQFVRDLRESLLGFVQGFVDSIQHTSGGGRLINTRSSTWGLRAASGGALHRFSLMRLLAGVNEPYQHTISHALILPCFGFLREIVTIARVATLLGGLVHRASPPAVSVGARRLLQRTSEKAPSRHSG